MDTGSQPTPPDSLESEDAVNANQTIAIPPPDDTASNTNVLGDASLKRTRTREDSLSVDVDETKPLDETLESLSKNGELWKSESCQKKKAMILAFYTVGSFDCSVIGSDYIEVECILCHGKMSWKKKNGTSSLINHVSGKHNDVYNAFREFTSHQEKQSKKPRISPVTSVTRTFRPDIRKHLGKSQYSTASSVQKQFVTNLVLLVGKSLRPLSSVECPWTRKLIKDIDLRLSFPSRKTFSTYVLPSFACETKEKFVITPIKSAEFICLTFDLWMSRGNQDIFSVIAHWLDHNLQMTSRHLQLIQMDGTSGAVIASKLSELLGTYGIKNKIVAHVTDGGANLSTCTTKLIGTVQSEYLDLDTPFRGHCWAHVMSLCCKQGLRSEHCDGLSVVNIDAIKKKLQSAITWTKKSGKGARAWAAACVKAKLQPVKLYTPVKTRFGSVIIMFKQMWKYRDAVHFCYSDPSNTANNHREPSPTEWRIVRFFVRILSPIVDACILNQGLKFWSISDATVLGLRLVEQYSVSDSFLSGAGGLEDDPVGNDLSVWEFRVSKSIKRCLQKYMKCFFDSNLAFHAERSGHSAIGLMVDPRFKSMKCLLGVMTKEEGQTLISHYNEIVLKLLCRIYKMEHQAQDIIDLDADGESNDLECTSNPFFGGEELDEEDAEVKGLLKSELTRFRNEKYCGESDFCSAMRWMVERKKVYPHIFKLVSAILCITGSQIENERSFSIAGIVASQKRSRLSIESLESIMQIYHNYPATPDFIETKNMKDIVDVAEKEHHLDTGSFEYDV